MTQKNGNLWKIIATVITLVAAGVAIVATFTEMGHQTVDNADDIAAMAPEVEKNKEHRIKFEEKVNNIERDVGLILTEVRK